ncbi:HNH endonuclease [Halococcus agarilyticus]|uniref:HNH endonuclease n=1 Tax=Halococcus agarilyticus TaxID=1232219 RepID=UPI0018968518|nr:hypothetical protein [Halococcus agarilyticus]
MDHHTHEQVFKSALRAVPIYPEEVQDRPEDAYLPENVIVLCARHCGLLESNLTSPLELLGYAGSDTQLPPETLPETRQYEDQSYTKGTSEHAQGRQYALDRDDWTCRCCGMNRREHQALHNESIHTHHMAPLHSFDGDEEQFHSPFNLITVCQDCHSILEWYFPSVDSQVEFCSRNEGEPLLVDVIEFVEQKLGVPHEDRLHAQIIERYDSRQATFDSNVGSGF